MIGLLITIMLVLAIIGLLVWAASMLSQVGVPQPVVVVLQICIILVGVLLLLQRVGLLAPYGVP